MSKILRIIAVVGLSLVVFLIFGATAGIIPVQGAVDEKEFSVPISSTSNRLEEAGLPHLEDSQTAGIIQSVAVPNADVDLQVALTDSPDPVIAGSTLTYTVDILNNSAQTATLVTLTDTLPAEVTLISSVPSQGTCTGTVCDLGTMLGGSSANVTLTVAVDPSFSGTIDNQVEVGSSDNELVPGDNIDNETTTVDLEADLSIVNLDEPDPVIAGMPLTYTLVITNFGPSDASAITLTDTFPTNVLNFISMPSTCSRAGPNITCQLGDLGAGMSTQVTLLMSVKSSGSNPLNNSAGVFSSSTSDPDPTNNQTVEPTTIIFSSDLSIAKADDPDPVSPGDTLTYTLTVANGGPSDADGVVVTDTLPSEVNLISITPSQGTCTGTICSLGGVISGGSANVSLVTTVDVAAGGNITNTAEVDSLEPDPVPGNNLAEEITFVDDTIFEADLAVFKSGSPDPVTAGGVLTYTVTITNLGTTDATNVVLVDTLPGEVAFISSIPTCTPTPGSVSCNLGTLATGATTDVSLVVQVDPGASGSLLNTADATSDLPDPNPSNNQADETTTVIQSADIALGTIDNPDPVNPGGTLTYTLSITNVGPSDAIGVVVTETLPTEASLVSITPSQGSCTGTVCSMGTLPAGDNASVTVVSSVSLGASGIITNNAEVQSLEVDPNPSNNFDSEDTTIDEIADLTITKSGFPDPVAPGELLTYTVNVTNLGPSSAPNVSMVDTLPNEVVFVSSTPETPTCTPTFGILSCDLGELTDDATTDVTIVVQVDPGANGPLINAADVSSDVSDPDPNNNHAEETTALQQTADLSVDTIDNPDPVIAGSTLTYTLTIVNLGLTDVPGVVLTETLPNEVSLISITPSQGTCVGTVCELGTLPSGDNAVVVVESSVSPSASGILTNTAEVQSSEEDPNPDNNVDIENTLIDEVADLTVTKSGFPDPVAPGDLLTYTINVTNLGPSSAQNVSLVDTLPAAVTFVSSQPGAPTCSESSGVVTCGTWTLAPQESTGVNITVQVDPMAVGPLVNEAQVTSDVFDPDQSNNQAAESTSVVASADLAVSTSGDPEPADPGDILTYTLTVTNNGPYLTSGVTLIDTLPDEVTLLSADPSQGMCTGTICSLGIIAAGNSAQVNLVGLIALDASGVITNTAQVFGQLYDPIPGNNLDLEYTTVGPGADLALTKTASPNPVVAGENLTYSLSIQNQGLSSALNVTLVDTLPGNVNFISSTPGAPTCAQAAGTVTCNLGAVAADEVRNVNIIVQVDTSATGSLFNQAHVSSITFDPDEVNNTATEETMVMIPDTASPTVEWVYPVGNEQTYFVGTEILLLEAEANDNVAVERVDFKRWDYEIEQFIDIGSSFEAPYSVDFDTSVLYYGFNELDVWAYDTSGNVSTRRWIFLFRLELEHELYLPIIAR